MMPVEPEPVASSESVPLATGAPDDTALSAPYRMTPQEIAWGFVTGEPAHIEGTATGARVARAGARDPLDVLRAVVARALLRPPCLVEFSGGRDSSLVLAVALEVARRESLPLPVAVTFRFPGYPEADESAWQEAVVRHLGVTEWVRLDGVPSFDLLGPTSTTSLGRTGVVWPPLAHSRGPVLAMARGGSLVTGEGGDEVFGAGRATPLRQVLGRMAPLDARAARHLALALAPRPLRRAGYRRLYRRHLEVPWLAPGATDELVSQLAAEAAREPLDQRRALPRLRLRRSVALGLATVDALAAAAGVQCVHPLLDSTFLAALARKGGPLGFTGRDAAMAAAASEVLPRPVLRRHTKARFNAVAFGPHSRRFAARWRGEGVCVPGRGGFVVPPGTVDAERLAAMWAAPEPPAGTFALLQACWLAARPRPTTGIGAP